MVDCYIASGICPCIKHMPGHGRAESDPHLGLPVLNYPLKELAKDFYPFISNNNCPAGMTAHIVVPEIDNKPVTMSKKAIDSLIRGIIGFKGLLFSDAIDMKALKGSVGEKTKGSIEAGCDVVCYCNGKEAELQELFEACPDMSDNSLDRWRIVSEIVKSDNTISEIKETEYHSMIGSVEEYNENYDATEVLNLMKNKK